MEEKILEIDFHNHLRVLPEDLPKDREAYARAGRVAIGYEGIKRSALTACLCGFGGGIAKRCSPLTWNFDNLIWDLGMRQADIDHHQDVVMRGYGVKDIMEAKKSGKTAVIPMVENGGLINDDLDRVDVLYGCGIRCMGLSFNHRSSIADGILERTDSGLSNFGLKVIERMNRLGILIDFSHSSDLTIKQGVEASEVPCCCTHTLAKGLNDNPKGRSDETLELIAKNGGLVGAEAVPNITSNKEVQTVFDMIDHVDYMVKLVGVDHVAIGTDTLFGDHVGSHKATKGLFGAAANLLKDFPSTHIEYIENPGQFPNVTRALVARGYSDEDIKKIIGGNALRLLEQTIG